MKNEHSLKTQNFINLIFLILLLTAFIFAAFSLVKNLDAYHNKDFFTFWLGGRLTSQGQDVYDQATWVTSHAIYGSTWIPNLYYVYPLTTAVLFVPLGMLPIESAAVIWLVVSFIMIVASLVLLLRLWRVPEWTKFIIPFTLGLLLFRPVDLIFLMGQIDGLLLFIIVIALCLISEGKNPPAHVLLGFLILKPNIGVPVLCFYALWLLWQKRWKDLLFLGGSTLLLLLIPVLIDSHWIEKYIHVGLYKSQDQNLYPSLRGLSGLIAGNRQEITLYLWLLFSIFVSGVLVYFIIKYWKKLTDTNIFIFAIIVTLLVTPYMRSYDFLLLLIPILYSINIFRQRSRSFLHCNLVFLGWGIYSFGFVLLANRLGHDIWSVLFPISVLGIYLFTLSREKGKQKGAGILA